MRRKIQVVLPVGSLASCAVFFDVDGTMVDSHSLHFEAYRRVLSDLCGPDILWSDYMDWCLRRNSTFEELLESRGFLLPVGSLHKLKSQWYRQMAEHGLELCSGFSEVWSAFAMCKVHLGLVSTGRRASVEIAQAACPLPIPPDVVISREDVGPHVKPSPFCYQLAAERCGVEPHDCLVFDDAPAGVRAAKSAGMICLGIRSTIFSEQELAEADVIIDDLGQIEVLSDNQAEEIQLRFPTPAAPPPGS